MLRNFKERFKLQYYELKALKIAYTKKETINVTRNKLAFVMLAANYDNLGDIAITKAQQEFLQRVLPKDYEIVVIPHDKTFNVYLSMKKLINKDTIITLIGGGNSGTLYEFIEWPRRFILKNFKDSKIISFPQSVFYGDGKYDLKYKKEFIKLAKNCKSLTLVAREEMSYLNYKEMIGDACKILLVPDIVFTLKADKKSERSGACLVFRNDKEKSLDSELEKKLVTYCKNKYTSLVYADTCSVKVLGTGYTELYNFIDVLKTKEIVVTDRLHGMILSYITDTPCLCIDNNNHKIKSTYNTWLVGSGNVVLLENPVDLNNICFNEEQVILDEKFDPLKKALLEGL